MPSNDLATSVPHAGRRALVGTLVVGGLVASVAVNFGIERPEALPGVALGSHALLADRTDVGMRDLGIEIASLRDDLVEVQELVLKRDAGVR